MKNFLALLLVVVSLAAIAGCSHSDDAAAPNAPTTNNPKANNAGAAPDGAGSAKPSSE